MHPGPPADEELIRRGASQQGVWLPAGYLYLPTLQNPIVEDPTVDLSTKIL